MSTSDDRLFAAAAALRELVNVFTDREIDDELLDEITETATKLAAAVGTAPPWDRQAALERGLSAPRSLEGRRTQFPHRALYGPANPTAIPTEFKFGDAEVTAQITLEAVHGGAPGRGHGGVLSGLLDEIMGAVPSSVGAMGATARLTVNYRAPIPLGEPLRFRAWLHERDGRKIIVHADVRRGDDLIADADALFIAINYAEIDTSGAARH